MKLKNFLEAISIAIVLLITVPAQSFATTAPVTTFADPGKNDAMLKRISARVEEIQNMDKSNLSDDEKKALRKELKGMYKDARGLDQKVYISVGAIIIVILLLILILK